MNRFTILLFSGILMSLNTFSQTTDAVSMGAGYANEIYYSFENGEVKSEPRNNWDIAFFSTVWSAGIIINEGNNVELYNYPYADTSAWMNMDTAGISGWKPVYNSESSWEEGAFNRFSKDHPDYGWGVYNPVTHDVEGDSLYFIKLSSGEFKKLWIRKKNSVNNTYYFRYANLDNSNEVNEQLDCNNYTAKNFAYYSIVSGSELDREPDTGIWDIVFTKYQAIQPTGGFYPVTGVCSNIGVYANEFNQVGPDFEDWQNLPLDTSKTVIGWDWKYFDMGLFQYVVDDSTAFFVQTKKGDVYKLVFADFEGTSSGNIIFTIKKLSSQGINDITGNEDQLELYPNPAHDIVTFSTSLDDFNLRILSMNGKTIYSIDNCSDRSLKVPVSIWAEGVYFVLISQGNTLFKEKLIVK